MVKSCSIEGVSEIVRLLLQWERNVALLMGIANAVLRLMRA